MNNIESNKKILMITVLISILIILFIIYLVVQRRISNPSNTNPQPTISQAPVVTPVINEDPEGPALGQTGYEIDDETEDQLEAVANLTRLVPYNGTYFRIEYSTESGNYIVTIQQSNSTEGDSEFNTFLTDNNIRTREWIPNLVIQYQ